MLCVGALWIYDANREGLCSVTTRKHGRYEAWCCPLAISVETRRCLIAHLCFLHTELLVETSTSLRPYVMLPCVLLTVLVLSYLVLLHC